MSAIAQTSSEKQLLTILQLDTCFPRIPGDVACPETYSRTVGVQKIPNASVARIVNKNPDKFDISSFEAVCAEITQGVAASSCGFLGYWQKHLAACCPRPFISSALIDLPQWQQNYADDEIAIVTFDADILGTPLYQPLLAGFSGKLIGLKPEMHLSEVIRENRAELDIQRAETELVDLLSSAISGGKIKALVLECTNLPPYKRAIKSACDVEIYDILTSIDARVPQLVKPEFL